MTTVPARCRYCGQPLVYNPDAAPAAGWVHPEGSAYMVRCWECGFQTARRPAPVRCPQCGSDHAWFDDHVAQPA